MPMLEIVVIQICIMELLPQLVQGKPDTPRLRRGSGVEGEHGSDASRDRSIADFYACPETRVEDIEAIVPSENRVRC